jgi:hypothetical protein
MPGGQRGGVDENSIDTILCHHRESPREVRDSEYRSARDLNAKLLAGGLGCLQGRLPEGAVGVHSAPNLDACGTASFNISIALVVSSICTTDNPVMFPPGRARLSTCPTPTGRHAWKTMGIVLVACLARSVSVEEVAEITSTSIRTNSVAAAFCSPSTVFLPAKLDGQILALDMAESARPRPERLDPVRRSRLRSIGRSLRVTWRRRRGPGRGRRNAA